MKGAWMILVLVASLLGGCGTVKKVGKATTDLVTGGDDPLPESTWNAERTWIQIGINPPTYAPYGFRGPPGKSGQWFRDQRDGKQLFVPSGGVEGIPEGVLRAEALKATRK
jgi:predicted small secreted protein